ncbi:methionyl-tRNA formyltransferase [Pontibacter diazotrophicus]|uniref:Methionyl-tRNA formyltransferase n=1 Tax=Pontibacter diazotrophicus TaxID=1400979 RepID=A0A3D8LFH0_9BACT|nr:formyltransferase family protein [Pontibacter diazotrophicus]RDV16123.1 methionyl-tRNA formyltransferase [Pontibacter diazotrophicus]
MKVVFIGTVEFSKKALLKLLELKVNVVGVITKAKSDFNADFVSLEEVCEEKEIPYKLVRDINHPNNIAWIQERSPDVLFCFGWSSLLKADILSLAPMGVVGYHPALIPQNKGRHPIIWALVLGLDKTGSTFFFMDEGADTGDILNQKALEIAPDDDAGTLYSKLVNLALKQIEEFVPQLQAGEYPRIPQEEEGNSWRKRGRKDGEIDWRMSSENIRNLVRGLTRPYVGAHFMYKGGEYKVWKCETVATAVEKNIEPGKVIEKKDGSLLVKTGDTAIRLTEFDLTEDIEIGEYLI